MMFSGSNAALGMVILLALWSMRLLDLNDDRRISHKWRRPLLDASQFTIIVLALGVLLS